MADKIKGITIEIGGNVKPLKNAIREVNKESKALQTELNQVERLLKLDPTNTELIAQKQQLLKASIQETEKALKAYQKAGETAQEKLAKGEITQAQFRELQREIIKTEQKLNRLNNSANAMTKEQKELAEATSKLKTLLEAADKKLEDFADELGSDLVQALQKGTASSSQLNEAIAKIGQRALGGKADLDKLHSALKKLDDGGSIKQVREDLKKLAAEAEKAETEVKHLDSTLSGIAGMGAGVGAGLGLGEIVSQAMTAEDLKTKIRGALDIPEENLQVVVDAIRSVEAYGIAAEEALSAALSQWQLNAEASDEANAAIMKNAGAIAGIYQDLDLTELLQENREIASALKITKEESIALVNSLLKIGFPPAEIDIISEYGTQLQLAGYNAKEVQGIFGAGVETGTWNIDSLLDGVKTGRNNMAKFGAEAAADLEKIVAGTNISAQQLQEWGKAVAGGGEEGSEAMYEVSQAIEGIEDAALKNMVASSVFGSQWEDQGSLITTTLLNTKSAVKDLTDNQDQLNNTVSKLDESPAVKMRQAINKLKEALEPVYEVIAEVISKIADWISENPSFAAGIAIVVTALAGLSGVLMAVTPLLLPLAGVFSGLAAPIAAAVGAIVLLVSAIKDLWDNNEEFRTSVTEAWNSIKDSVGAAVENILKIVKPIWEQLQTIIGAGIEIILNAVALFLNILSGDWSGAWENIKNIFSAAWDAIKAFFIGFIPTLIGLGGELIWGLITAIASKAGELISQGWEIVTNFVSGIKEKAGDLITQGKELVNGLINGILSKAKELKDKVVNFVKENIPDPIAKLLGIKSPSKLTTYFGQMVVKGLANGLEDGQDEVQKASENLAKVIDNALQDLNKRLDAEFNLKIAKIDLQAVKLGDNASDTDQAIQAIEKLYAEQSRLEGQIILLKAALDEAKKGLGENSTAAADYQNQLSLLEIELSTNIEKLNQAKIAKEGMTGPAFERSLELANLKLEIENLLLGDNASEAQKYALELKELALQKKEALAKEAKLEQAYAAANAEMGAASSVTLDYSHQLAIARLEVQKIEAALTKANKAYEASLAVTDEVIDKSKEQAEGFRELGAELKEVEESYRKDLIEALEEYNDKVEEVNQDLIESERKLTDQYNDELKSRTESLRDWVGLFDEVDYGEGVSGEGLLNNLQSQVEAFKNWQTNLNHLEARGLDKGLLTSLREMGAGAGAEIAALNTLTDEQLSQYQALWREKTSLARNEAFAQMESQRQEMENQLAQLRNEAAEQLEIYRQEWEEKSAEIRQNAAAEVLRIRQDFQKLAEDSTAYGVSLMQNFTAGISSQFDELEAVIAEAARICDEYMPHSPAKKGPLSRLDEWGSALVGSLTDGIKNNLPLLEAAMSNLAGIANPVPGAINPALAAGTINNSASTTNNNEFHISVKDGEDLLRTLRKLGVVF